MFNGRRLSTDNPVKSVGPRTLFIVKILLSWKSEAAGTFMSSSFTELKGLSKIFSGNITKFGYY